MSQRHALKARHSGVGSLAIAAADSRCVSQQAACKGGGVAGVVAAALSWTMPWPHRGSEDAGLASPYKKPA
ncbi:hypothetical protein [Dyella silvatica]|uniref:hypothetical protein n=1 Tax=Dyella silvatica TaxID=2992128 RepID=UPI0022586053|nr:hypothetical protein [Dyella silvatica]